MQIKYSNIGAEPVTLSQVKSWLKIDFDTDDALITSLITGIRERIEEFTGLSLVVKTIEYFNEEIPEVIELPYPSHDEIEEIKVNGTEVTDSLVTGLNQKIVEPAKTYTFSGNEKGIYIKYTTTGECPEAIKTAIKKAIDEQYRNRGNTFEGSIAELSENSYVNLMQFVKA